MTGSLFVITAASGTGKTSLVKALLETMDNISVSISHTTRQPRDGEINGKDYHFTSVDNFLADATAGAFIEYAQVFDNYYGTMQKTVEDMLNAGTDVILEIDWQGAEQVRKIFNHATTVFILPPSKQALRERLSNRGQDSNDVIEKRLAGSLKEMNQYVNFDYLVVNDVFETALSDLISIINSKRLEISKQSETKAALLQKLFN